MATNTFWMPSEETHIRIAAALEAMNGQTNPLAQLDGTAETYKKVMRAWFIEKGASESSTAAELTALCAEWYKVTREAWSGYTTFYQPSVSAVSTGTAGGDNEGLTCVPSTNTTAGQDDYAGLPLFACVDVNWTVDATTLEPMITAIDGITNNFKRTDPSVYVGVMQQSGYHFWSEDDDTYLHGYSALSNIPYKNVAPVPEAVKASDNTMREFVVHAKYMAGYDAMTCCSGTPTGTYIYSHNSVHTKSQAIGTQYSGSTTADNSWLQLMTMIKYKSMTLDGILNGCLVCNYQYYAQAAETGVKRMLLTAANAANLEVGMRVIIGAYDGSSLDRGTATNYSVTGQAGALITEITDVTVNDTTYTAVYVDTDATFDTVANGNATSGTTLISTMAWDTGMTDAVLGNDGAPVSATGAKHPIKLQGIEFMTGCFEVYADVILNIYPADDDYTYGYYKPAICKIASKQSTSVTTDYTESDMIFAKTASAVGSNWIKKLGFDGEFFFPILGGGSSSTYTRDRVYETAEVTALSTREWRAFGGLAVGVAGGGLSGMHGDSTSLSSAGWSIGARLSPNGNRGEWVA